MNELTHELFNTINTMLGNSLPKNVTHLNIEMGIDIPTVITATYYLDDANIIKTTRRFGLIEYPEEFSFIERTK